MFNVQIDSGVGDLAAAWRLRVAGRRDMLLARAWMETVASKRLLRALLV